MTLALESVGDDGASVLVSGRDVDVTSLESAGGWSLLTVEGVAPAKTLRVLIRVAPSEDGPRGGAVKLDDAYLLEVPEG